MIFERVRYLFIDYLDVEKFLVLILIKFINIIIYLEN